MPSYSEFHTRYRDEMNIFIVYLMEAHFVIPATESTPLGGWPIGTDYRLRPSESVSERIDNARALRATFDIDIDTYVDNMDNGFNLAHGAWPDMLYYLDADRHIRYIGRLTNGGGRPSAFTDGLAQYLSTI